MKALLQFWVISALTLFTYQMSYGQPPANDDCTGAISLTVSSGSTCTMATNGNTAGATQSIPGITCAGFTGTANDDVWFSFTATNAAHTVTVVGSTGFDAVVDVRSGACTGTNIACADATTGGGTEVVNLTGLTVGNIYLVRVYHWSSSIPTNTTFTICVTQPALPPANDECSGAIALPTIPSNGDCMNATVTTVGATGTPDAVCFGTENDDVWHTFTTPAGATTILYTNTTISGNGDRMHQLYSGSSCGGLTSISCHDPESGSFTGLTGNTTYYLRSYTYFTSGPTTFNLCLSVPPPPPVNDACAGAIALPMIPSNGDCMNAAITTVAATGTADPVCTGTEDDDVWHTFTTPAGATTVLYTNTSVSGNSDRVHQLYSGSSCGALTSIGCFDAESGSFTGLTGNTTYYLRTYTWSSGVSTTFNLCLRVPPPPLANDDCIGAISLPVNSGPTCGMETNGTTAGATQSLAGCAGTANDDVWYSFVATNTEHNVTVVGAASFDAVLNVRSGACNGTSIACVDNTFGGGTEVANLTGLTVGNTYLVRVHHWFSAVSSTPTFTICVTTPVPPCSAPSTPMVNSVGTTSASLSWGAVSGATLYRYSSGSGFHTCGSGSQTTAGTSVNLTGLAPNTTYTFCVRTDACGGGAASSYVSTTFTTNPLPNDNCSGAINISCGQTVSGSTVGATSDAAIGSCTLGSFGTPGSGTAVGGTPGLGVWYRLMGDGSQVSASLCNSSFDTKIHIYEGSCGTLTCVASNDDNSAQCSPGSRSYVQFNTNPGSTYYILVSGFSSSTGNFSLQIGCVCGAPLGFPWTTTAVGGASGESIDNVCGGSIDISSNGYSTATSDKMMLSSQQICGDASITVRVANITNQGYAGITMRESTAPGSKQASLSTQLANRVFREARSFTNGPAQKQQLFRPGHSWLRIVRTGNIFTFYSSSNGSQWGFVGTSTITMPNCVEVGMFTTGLTPTLVATAVFTDVDLTGNQQITLDDNGNTAQFKAEIPLNDEVSIFPNPSSGEVNLKLGQDWIGQSMEITVFNGVGKVVMNENIDQVNFDIHSFSLDRVASGIYFLQVKGENGMSKTERIVINK